MVKLSLLCLLFFASAELPDANSSTWLPAAERVSAADQEIMAAGSVEVTEAIVSAEVVVADHAVLSTGTNADNRMLSATSDSMDSTPEHRLLHQGLDLEAAGHYEDALEVWASAFTELDTPSLAVGREYIRLTVEQNLRGHYETASAIYLWGLTAESVEANRPALEKELAYLEPLAGRDLAREWEELLEDGDPDLYRQIRLFWESLNPTPGTRYNERLLEHWERIAYAREHYDRRDNPPYGTDDRGPYYVRYGEPDRQVDGFLRADRGRATVVCSQLPTCIREHMPIVVMDLDPQPYYEIWSYERPNEQMEYNLVVIFGETALGGFRRVETVEDFIPNQAFSFSDSRFAIESLMGGRTTVGEKVTPGMVFQWLYYEQLSTVDFYFADRYSNMMVEWDLGVGRTPPNFGKHQGPMQEQRTRAATRQNWQRAPEEISTYDKEFPDIPLDVYQYRMLDEADRPVLVTFLESRPRFAFTDDLAANQGVLLPEDATSFEEALRHYRLTHGLQLRDADGEVISGDRRHADLVLDYRGDLPSSSVFTLPHLEEPVRQVLYAELHNRHPDSSPTMESTFPQSLRGLGRIELPQPEPLDSEPGRLLASDLIVGIQKHEEPPEGSLFPFVVSNNRTIPEGEELVVHFEVYRLGRDEGGTARFEVAYEIEPKRSGLRELLSRNGSDLSITLNFETDESRFAESIEIETQGLEVGDYRLYWTIRDLNSGEEIRRELEFEVSEGRDAADVVP